MKSPGNSTIILPGKKLKGAKYEYKINFLKLDKLKQIIVFQMPVNDFLFYNLAIIGSSHLLVALA